MSSLYNDFEKRFTNAWFSASWNDEAEVKPKQEVVVRKDAKTLETELNTIKEEIENIELKQLRLANLAKLYNN